MVPPPCIARPFNFPLEENLYFWFRGKFYVMLWYRSEVRNERKMEKTNKRL